MVKPGMYISDDRYEIIEKIGTLADEENITIENLHEVADPSYQDTSWMPTCDWMIEILGR